MLGARGARLDKRPDETGGCAPGVSAAAEEDRVPVARRVAEGAGDGREGDEVERGRFDPAPPRVAAPSAPPVRVSKPRRRDGPRSPPTVAG